MTLTSARQPVAHAGGSRQALGPVGGGGRPGPYARRALGVDRQALRLCNGGAPVFKIFELLGPLVQDGPGRPARACSGLLRPFGCWPPWAGCKRTCDRQ